MIRAVEHIAIVARDTEALARWYRDTLGFRVVVAGKGQSTWFVGPPTGAVIEILPAGDAAGEAPLAPYAQNEPGLRHLAFTVDDFDATCAALKAEGVEFVGEMIGSPGGRRLAFIADPEGNLLQLVYRPQPLGSETAR